MDYLNELLWRNGRLLDVSPVVFGLAQVAIDVHWLVEALEVAYVDLVVHVVQDDAVLLVIDSSNVHSDSLGWVASFHPWERFEQAFLF